MSSANTVDNEYITATTTHTPENNFHFRRPGSLHQILTVSFIPDEFRISKLEPLLLFPKPCQSDIRKPLSQLITTDSIPEELLLCKLIARTPLPQQ